MKPEPVDVDLLLWRECRVCGKQLHLHTMFFATDGKVDTNRPIRCPLGQAAMWTNWENALPELDV